MASGASEFKFYHYDPSMTAAVVFIACFLITTALHTYQFIRTRTWFLIPLVIGGFFEWIGYVGRAISSQQSPNWTLGPYLIQTLLLLVAPALFAASIYMALGRIILLVDGEQHSLIRKRWLTKIFVCGDVISFFAQGAGGGIQASGTATSLTTGSHIIVGGLFVQLIFFGLFIIVAIVFHMRMHSAPTVASLSVPWKTHMYTLYATSLLIMIRSIFRVVEYLQGFSGYILSHEIYLYIFDACLMFAVMVIFNFIHPSEIQALLKGGKAANKGWRMNELQGKHQRVSNYEV
ncbi:RTA1 domain protein [Cadophora sp. DSE1049]|nr:RTA1 domain protein [Cadophora sp. DSE1049]